MERIKHTILTSKSTLRGDLGGLFFLFVLFLSSCDSIGQDERFVEVIQVAAKKTVLIIEFTDQKCVNCPQANILIDNLKEEYTNNLISVSIHSYVTNLPLVTQIGKEYNTLFQPSAYVHPAAMVDGSSTMSVNTEEWANLVREAVQKDAGADLSLSCSYDSVSKTITTISKIRGIKPNVNQLKLQLWLTEDSVKSRQLMGDGVTTDYNYIHNNVFRTTLNGSFGEAFQLSPGLIVADTTSFTISNAAWNIKNLQLVGFIYTGDSFHHITNAVKVKIKNN